MTQNRRTVLGCVLTLLVLSQAPARAQLDKEKMQGTWKVTYAAYGFVEKKREKIREATEAERKAITIIIKGNELTYIAPGKDGDESRETVHFRLKHPADGPRVIEFLKDPKDKELHWHGIYEFDGKVLRLCWGKGGAERPSKFSPRDQQRYYIIERR
jgi:uncharacterized protein (TIGR03067 family)